MSSKKNILVFPCGSEIALNICSSVRNSTYFHLIGASSVDDHGKFAFDDYAGGLPFVDDDSFIPALAKVIKEHNIDAVYPTMDSVIAKAKTHESILGCKIISSPVDTAAICLSKRRTYEKLRGTVKVPEIYNPENLPEEKFPVFVKPDIGYSSKGTSRISSSKELSCFLEGKENLLVLEYLPGEECTVDCFTDRTGALLYSRARRRNRIGNGISTNTSFAEVQSEFEALALKINSALEFRGAWFFQVKRDKEGILVLMEVASRIGGSSLLSRAVGVNLALLTLFDAFDYEVSICSNRYDVVLDRALGSSYRTDLDFDCVYCDYDDCLVLENSRINTEMVKFLYDCVNAGRKIFLLTRHKDEDLQNKLARFRLDTLFDGIIRIPADADKADFIAEKNAIFIDDSFAERLNIKNKLGIPVFGPEMIDVLSL